MARHLEPAEGVTQKPGLGPNDDVVPLAETLSPADGVMLVGHLPSLERLTAQLVTGVSERPVFALQNGASSAWTTTKAPATGAPSGR